MKPKAQSPKPGAQSVQSPDSARLAALKLLSRRELSEAQVRQRLARKGHAADEIDLAVEGLKRERAIDDERVAGAIARTETGVKRRGRIRVHQQIARAGIAAATAHRAIDETFADIDDDELLRSALSRRLKGDRPIADDREFQRLYRYLTGQGFSSDRVLKTLTSRRRTR